MKMWPLQPSHQCRLVRYLLPT
uniref:Uncharacterized protein n=1 Tax=Arundo donax TaxID=35708 RepID=A0A0A8ZJE8_ARUDO